MFYGQKHCSKRNYYPGVRYSIIYPVLPKEPRECCPEADISVKINRLQEDKQKGGIAGFS
jgi:hypothetical protein